MYAVPPTTAAETSDACRGNVPAVRPRAPTATIRSLVLPRSPPPKTYVVAPIVAPAASWTAAGRAPEGFARPALSSERTQAAELAAASSPPIARAPEPARVVAGSCTAAGRRPAGAART